MNLAEHAARRVRWMGIVLSWAVWIGTIVVAVTWHVAQIWLALAFVLGFAPYIICLQVVEPWLARHPGRMPPN